MIAMIIRLTLFISIVASFRVPVSMAEMDPFRKGEMKALGGPQLAEDHELRYLPRYCWFCAAVNQDRYRHEKTKWAQILKTQGEPIGLHHYCYGLLYLSRLQRGVGKPSALLARAEAEFNYVIIHSSPQKNILLPEVHLKMGITKKLMGKNAEAIKHFYESIKLKKDYPIAYGYIIDFYKEHNNYQSAIEIAQKGLKYCPNS